MKSKHMQQHSSETIVDTTEYQKLNLGTLTMFKTGLWTEWLDEDRIQQLGLNISEGGVGIVGGEISIKKSVLKELGTHLQKKIAQEEIGFFQTIQATSILELQILTEKLTIFTKAPLTSTTLEDCLKIAKSIVFYEALFTILSWLVEEELKTEATAKRTSSNEVASFTRPVHALRFQQQKEALRLKLRLQEQGLMPQTDLGVEHALATINAYPTLRKEVTKHLADFDWINAKNGLGGSFNSTQLLEQMLHLSPLPTRAANPQHRISSHLIFLIEADESISLAREIANDSFTCFIFRTQPFLQKIAQHLHMTLEEVLNLTPSKLRTAL